MGQYDLTPARVARILAQSDDSSWQRVPAVGYRLRWVAPGADARMLAGPCMVIEPAVNPVFDALMQRAGARRIDERRWSVPAAAAPSVIEIIDGAATFTDRRDLEKMQYSLPPEERADAVVQGLVQMQAAGKNELKELFVHAVRSPTGPGAFSNLIASFTHGKMQLKATTGVNGADGMLVTSDQIDLHLWQRHTTRPPQRLRVDEALRLVDALSASGVYIDDCVDLPALRVHLQSSLVIYQRPSAPGLSRLVVGPAIRRVPGLPLIDRIDGTFTTVEIDSSQLVTLLQRAHSYNVKVIVDEPSLDNARLASAQPIDDPTLRPYQQLGVSLHLATTIGFLNACAIGLGKTVMTLKAWQIRSRGKPRWHALVVCPTSIRSQWLRETARFFPDAAVITLDKLELAQRWDEFATLYADRPCILVVSHDTMRSSIDSLCARHWDEVCLDEAETLRNPASKRSRALWKLREACDTAIALAGTPIERSLDDLGQILSWVRADKDLFERRLRLRRAFDMSVPGDGARLHRLVGPMMFRRDQSEVADELPTVSNEVIVLDPSEAEMQIAQAAQAALLGMLDQLDEKAEASNALRLKAVNALKTVRRASSDPSSLAETLQSARQLLPPSLLELLDQPLVATKRQRVVEMTTEMTQRGDAVLIFTEFGLSAQNLARELSASGVRCGLFTGKVSREKRDQQILDFQDGKIDVLVMTAIARQGLNLQRANVVIHYDLPWLPSRIVHRVGRTRRLESLHDHVRIVTVVMAATIEERIAQALLPRAQMIIEALDTPRGAHPGSTEMDIAVNGLQDALDNVDDFSELDCARQLIRDGALAA